MCSAKLEIGSESHQIRSENGEIRLAKFKIRLEKRKMRSEFCSIQVFSFKINFTFNLTCLGTSTSSVSGITA